MGWLNRHDKDCGSLYGMLPLVKNMPVALEDHLDQNPEKQLLRGKVGFVDGWVLHEEEDSTFEDGHRIFKKAPKVVFVRYQKLVGEGDEAQWEDCSWVIGGLPLGVYPVRPWPRRWTSSDERWIIF